MPNLEGKIFVFVLLGVVAVPLLLFAFQFVRTCYGTRCLDQYRTTDGSYQIPGAACFQPPFLDPAEDHHRYPRLARQYFRTQYLLLGDLYSLVIYSKNQDRYIVIHWRDHARIPALRDPDFCESDFRFEIQ
jgi:hypothetical protein